MGRDVDGVGAGVDGVGAGCRWVSHGGQVRAALPNASLHVYYGFWPYAMWREQPHLVALKAELEPLLDSLPGVHYYGMRSETDLARAYADAGFYAYPSDKPETSGIALMKAQVMHSCRHAM